MKSGSSTTQSSALAGGVNPILAGIASTLTGLILSVDSSAEVMTQDMVIGFRPDGINPLIQLKIQSQATSTFQFVGLKIPLLKNQALYISIGAATVGNVSLQTTIN